MEKSKSQFDFDTNWYELWSRQSQEFYRTAEKNLKDIFDRNTAVNPEDHMRQIHHWLDSLRHQWSQMSLTEEQKAYQAYWAIMAKVCNDASNLMLDQWIQRTREKQPINSIRELYEMWLNCCHDIYQRTMQTKTYHDAYGDFMNAAFKYWQSAINK